MACYYCDHIGFGKNIPELGICKACLTAACGAKTHGHGEKCKFCRIFFCSEHFNIHSEEHGTKAGQAFSLAIKTPYNAVMNYLKNPRESHSHIVELYARQLAQASRDPTTEVMLNEVVKTIKEVSRNRGKSIIKNKKMATKDQTKQLVIKMNKIAQNIGI